MSADLPSPAMSAGARGYPSLGEITDGVETGVERAERSGRSLRFAYADPPYYGLAAKFYGHLHTEAADYDKLETHAALIAKLCAEYDGWAMSLHTPTLRDILPLCPPDVRVMAWVKPFASFKPGVGVAYAWEPLIVRGGRRRTRQQFTVRDWHACNITLRRGFTGAKPEGVIEWLLQVLNVEESDTFDDLFHGSGAVSRAVANYFARPQLALSVGGGGAERQGDMLSATEATDNVRFSDSPAQSVEAPKAHE